MSEYAHILFKDGTLEEKHMALSCVPLAVGQVILYLVDPADGKTKLYSSLFRSEPNIAIGILYHTIRPP